MVCFIVRLSKKLEDVDGKPVLTTCAKISVANSKLVVDGSAQDDFNAGRHVVVRTCICNGTMMSGAAVSCSQPHRGRVWVNVQSVFVFCFLFFFFFVVCLIVCINSSNLLRTSTGAC